MDLRDYIAAVIIGLGLLLFVFVIRRLGRLDRPAQPDTEPAPAPGPDDRGTKAEPAPVWDCGRDRNAELAELIAIIEGVPAQVAAERAKALTDWFDRMWQRKLDESLAADAAWEAGAPGRQAKRQSDHDKVVYHLRLVRCLLIVGADVPDDDVEVVIRQECVTDGYPVFSAQLKLTLPNGGACSYVPDLNSGGSPLSHSFGLAVRYHKEVRARAAALTAAIVAKGA